MPRRIEIELTSSRDDGTWTWRAAGAKAPRGTVPSTLLPTGSSVGDVLRVDAEFFVDGIEITGVLPAKGARQEPERIELIVPSRDEPLVTTTLAGRGRDDRGPRRDGPRREGRDGPRREGGRTGAPRHEGERPRGEGRGGDRPGGGRGSDRAEGPGGRPPGGERTTGRDRPTRRARPEPPPMPVVERPKSKRLRPGRVHRSALLASLPEEHRPVAEQVLLGGLPAVRQAIEKQNAERAAAGEAAVAAGPLLELAEKLVPKVRAAEWRDRAEAAQRDLEVLDLRDLRSVVSAADAAAKDDESRALAQALREGLTARADAEHQAWLAELSATVEVGRVVRALRLSSRPPKAGAPLPAELATKLTAAAGAALTDDAPAERWVAVLDALAFAPVRDKVIPASLPKDLHDDVKATIARLATRIPKIAHIFEIAPDPNAPRPKIERRRPPKKPGAARGAAAPAARPQPTAPAAAEAEATVPGAAEPESTAVEATETPAVAEAEPVAPEAAVAPVVSEPEPPAPEATDAPAVAEPEPAPPLAADAPAVSEPEVAAIDATETPAVSAAEPVAVESAAVPSVSGPEPAGVEMADAPAASEAEPAPATDAPSDDA